MLGCAEYCAYYDWTFEYLRKLGGEEAVADYWLEAIYRDKHQYTRELFKAKGLAGMEEYWGHTLVEEEAGYVASRGRDYYRIDMFACPSLGLLLRRGRQYYHDYCQHCMAWVGPVLAECGFAADHEHNHCGQCYWEIRTLEKAGEPSSPGEISGDQDVRLDEDWRKGHIDVFRKSKRIEVK